jgi:tyrocidine synthetase-3
VLLPTMVPSVIVALKEFCRLPNGKVDTDKLPQPDWAALAAGDQYVGPRTPVEQQLQRLWMEELQVDEAGMNQQLCLHASRSHQQL